MGDRKTGPLSVAERFYIENKLNEMTPSEIGEALARREETITKYVKTLDLPEPTEVSESSDVPEESEVEQAPKPLKSGDFIRNTTGSGDNDRGVAVMTKEAAELADEHRKRFSSKKNLVNQKGVFVLNPEKKCK